MAKQRSARTDFRALESNLDQAGCRISRDGSTISFIYTMM